MIRFCTPKFLSNKRVSYQLPSTLILFFLDSHSIFDNYKFLHYMLIDPSDIGKEILKYLNL